MFDLRLAGYAWRIFHIPGDHNMPHYDELLKLIDVLAGYKTIHLSCITVPVYV